MGVVICVLLTSFCEAQTLVDYQPANAQTTPALMPSTQIAGLTATNLTAGSGLFAEPGSYNWSDWNDTSTSFTGAVAANDFWTWGLTVDSGSMALNLTNLSLALQRSGDGPDDVEVQASINGGTNFSVLTGSFGGSTAVTTFSASGISAPLLNPGDSIDFTLAGFNSASVFGGLSLQSIPGSTSGLFLEGNFVPIPEPASASLLALAIAGAGLTRRRRA